MLKPFLHRLLLSFCLVFFAAAPIAAQPSSPPAVWAFADVHGAYEELVTLLQSVNLLDADGNWSGGTAKLISTGDLLDRGPHPRKVLDLLMRLEKQAKAAGGEFKMVLANHEVMALAGDFRYVTEQEYSEFADDESPAMRDKYFRLWLGYQKYSDPAGKERTNKQATSVAPKKTFDDNYPHGSFARYEAFLPTGIYGAWLLQKPFLLVEGNSLFTHGGLSPVLKGKKLATLNTELKQSLLHYIDAWQALIANQHLPLNSPFKTRHEHIAGTSAAQVADFKALHNTLLFSSQSPTWYRGAVYCHPYYEQVNLDQRLAQFNVERLFLGHSVTDSKRVEKSLQRVYLMDTGMLQSVYQGQASIVKIEPNQVIAYNSQGEHYFPADAFHHTIFYPPEIPFNELASILKNGEISQIEKLTTGITEPSRLTFADPRARVRALFKTIDTNPGIEKRRTRDSSERYADRYHYDIAAYRLSELLGLHLVPLSVEREINGSKGIVQYWVEDSFSEYTGEKEGWVYSGYCDYQQQRNLMNVFDLLIYNRDRNPTNIVIEEQQSQLVWIDHSRSFSIHTSLPDEIDRNQLYLPPQLRQALEKLNFDQLLEVMDGLLNRDQIKALLRRRDKVIRLADRLSDH